MSLSHNNIKDNDPKAYSYFLIKYVYIIITYTYIKVFIAHVIRELENQLLHNCTF